MNFYKERNLLVEFNLNRLFLDLPAFCRLFFEAKKMRASKLTLRKHAYQFKNFFNYVAKNFFNMDATALELTHLEQVTTEQINHYLESEFANVSSNYVQQTISGIKVLFSFYLKNNYINTNPAQNIIPPKYTKSLITKLTIEESNRLVSAISNDVRIEHHMRNANEKELIRDRTVIILFLSTGIRLSELVGLDYSNLDMTNKKIFIQRSKSQKQEIVYMTDFLVAQLQTYFEYYPVKVDSPLFITRHGNRLKEQLVDRMVKKYARLAGIKKHITPHKLRATFGTNIYEKTHDIFLTAKMLGHTNVATTTKYYVDVDEDAKRRALDGFRVI